MNKTGRKAVAVVAALIPFIVAAVVASQLFDTGKVLDKAKVWVAQKLGGQATPTPPGEAARPAPPAAPGPSEEKGRQVEKAYSELMRELEPQVVKQQVRIEKTRDRLEIRLLEQVIFDTGSARLTRQGQEVLAKTGQALAGIQGRAFTIMGHTDNVPITGLFPSNWELSTARACSVVRFLIERGHIEPGKLAAVGRADVDPVADNATEAGRAKNRRVDILVTDLECLSLPSRDAKTQSPP